MSRGTVLNLGSGGDTIDNEDLGGGLKLSRGKLVTGASGVDGGDVTFANPEPVGISDGTQLIGTSSHPVRTDPTGTTTQPVSISGTVPVSAASLPLPAGAALDATLTARLGTLGQKTMSASTPVAIASDQGALAVSGTVTANVGTTNGLALDATLTGGAAKTQIVNGGNTLPAADAAARALFARMTDGTNVAAVKPASTAPLATDPAIVVTISPNSGSASTVAQGTAAAVGAAWPVKITDGTNVPAVKPASTAPLATDPAIVVTVSPNSPSVGNPSVSTTGAAAPASATLMGATDGANLQAVRIKPASTAPLATDPAIVVTISPNSPASGNPSVSTTGSAIPLSATMLGGSDGTNLQPLRSSTSTPAGTEQALIVRPIPSGTQAVSAASLPLPTGAAADATVTARLGTLGQKTMSGSAPVTMASDQGPIGISGTVTVIDSVALTVAGTVTANVGTTNGLALDATLTGGSAKVQVVNGAAQLPAGDTQAHAIQVTTGDGTHTTPAGDASGRAIHVTQDVTAGAPLPVQLSVANAAATAANPVPSQLSQGGAVLSASNPAFASLSDGTQVIGVSAHPLRTDPTGTTTQPVSGTVTSNQGTAAGLGSAWPTKITDGTNTLPTGDAAARAIFEKVTDGTNTMAVKAASTAAAATDPAAVVSLSPNSPISYPARSCVPALGAASQVIKGSGGTLFALKLRNRTASTVLYAMLFNQTTVPADGAVTPFDVFLVPAASQVIVGTDYFTDSGIALGTGISMAFSTTESGTKTLSPTAANTDISAVFT